MINVPALQTIEDVLAGSNQPAEKGSNERILARNSLFFPVTIEPLGDIYRMAKRNRVECSTLPNMENIIMVEPTPGQKKAVFTCSDRYNLKSIEDIIMPIEDMLDPLYDYSATYRHDGHCRFYVDYIIHLPDGMTNDQEDKLLPRIRIQHSYSGDVKYEVIYGFWRQVCSNGLIIVNEGGRMNTKHCKKSLHKATTGNWLTDFVESASDYRKQYDLLGDRFIEDMDKRIAEVALAVKFPKGILELVTARVEYEHNNLGLPLTDWLIYNGFNHELNHNHDSLKMKEHNRVLLDREILSTMLMQP